MRAVIQAKQHQHVKLSASSSAELLRSKPQARHVDHHDTMLKVVGIDRARAFLSRSLLSKNRVPFFHASAMSLRFPQQPRYTPPIHTH